MLFIGDQPGGSIADEKKDERYIWPTVCEYVTATWHLANNMRNMFGPEFLMDCVGINANFFRSPDSKSWRSVPYQVRRPLEEFCQAKLLSIISVISPKQLVAIGFSTLDSFGPSTSALYGTNNRVLMKIGKVGMWPAVSTLHLSGARISCDDRLAIANAVLKLVKLGPISTVGDNGITGPQAFDSLNVQNRLGNSDVDTRVGHPGGFDMVNPKATLELLDDLEKLGLTNEAFQKLHHLKDTIHGFRKWCEKKSSFVAGGNNERVHERLKYVLERYRERGLPPGKTEVFSELAERAFVKIPPIPTGR